MRLMEHMSTYLARMFCVQRGAKPEKGYGTGIEDWARGKYEPHGIE